VTRHPPPRDRRRTRRWRPGQTHIEALPYILRPGAAFATNFHLKGLLQTRIPEVGGAMADLYLALTISSAVALAFLSATLVLPAF
jgi:hypothetical protein